MKVPLVQSMYETIFSKFEKRVKLTALIMLNGSMPFYAVISTTQTIFSHILAKNPSWKLIYVVS